MAEDIKKLTRLQIKFVDEYLKSGNASQAYVAAGGKAKDTHQAAYNLKNTPIVAELIEAENAKALDRAGVTKEAIIREYKKLGFASMADFMVWGTVDRERETEFTDSDGCTTHTTVTEPVFTVSIKDYELIDPDKLAAIAEVHQDGDQIKIKLHNKKDALDSLSRIMGLFKDTLDLTSGGAAFKVFAGIDDSKV